MTFVERYLFLDEAQSKSDYVEIEYFFTYVIINLQLILLK